MSLDPTPSKPPMPPGQNQFALLTKRRFLPMFITQFLGAFNDNVFKQALILLLTYQGAQQLHLSISLLNNVAALLFILPFFLLSATAGQIADKYDKAQLSRFIKVLELGIMLLAGVGFIFTIYTLLFIALFLMGVHSTLFGPIKYAYLPQALHTDELVGGNALFQTGTSLAILTGMMLAAVVVAGGDHNALIWTSATLVGIAATGVLSAHFIPKTPASAPNLTIDWNIFKTSRQTLADAWALPSVFYAIIGISWFWYYGATFLTQVPELTKTILFGNQSAVIFLLTLFSIGVAVGSLLCRRLSGASVNLKLLPVGIAGLSLFALDLFFALKFSALNGMAAPAHSLGLNEFIHHAGYWRIFIDLLGIGLFGGFYIVPLYTFMQAHAPEDARARIVAANNILNALFMVGSALMAMLLLSLLKTDLAVLFLWTALVNLVVGYIVWKKTRLS